MIVIHPIAFQTQIQVSRDHLNKAMFTMQLIQRNKHYNNQKTALISQSCHLNRYLKSKFLKTIIVHPLGIASRRARCSQLAHQSWAKLWLDASWKVHKLVRLGGANR